MNKQHFDIKLWLVMGIVLFFAILLQVNAKQVAPAISTQSTALATTITPATPQSPALSGNKDSLSLEGKWKFQIDPENNGLNKKWNEAKFNDSKWKEINVPSYWEDQGITTNNPNWTRDDFNNPYSGYAWYRKTIKIPATWTNNTVFLQLGKVDDLDWTYWNGELVGHIGEENEGENNIPYTSYNENRLYAIPPQKIKASKENVLAVRVCDIRGKGGIYEGPVELSYGVKPGNIRDEASYTNHQRDRVQIGQSIYIHTNESVDGDAVSIGGNITVDGRVTGDVVSIGGTVTLSSTAQVNGDVVTVGGSEDIDPSAIVKGQRVSVASGFHPNFGNLFGRSYTHNHNLIRGFGLFPLVAILGLMSLVLFICLAILIAVLVPDRIQRIANTINDTPGQSFGIGCLGLILTIPIGLLLLFTCIGIPLIPVWIVLVIIAWLVGHTAIGLLLGTKINHSFNWNIKSIVALVVLGVVVIGLVRLIPFLGFIVAFVLVTAGFGAVIMTKFGKANGPHVPTIPPTPSPVPPNPPTPPPTTPSIT